VYNGTVRREKDSSLRRYDGASIAVAKFLSGPPLPVDLSETPRPTLRRRIDGPPSNATLSEFQSLTELIHFPSFSDLGPIPKPASASASTSEWNLP
jgi:hypothetical protein